MMNDNHKDNRPVDPAGAGLLHPGFWCTAGGHEHAQAMWQALPRVGGLDDNGEVTVIDPIGE